MKSATYNRIRRLLPLLILAGLASRASTVSAGVGVWTSNGPYGGDIMALAIDPVNPATLYAGVYGSGVFKSTNAAGTWANTGLPDLYVRTLAISPSNPAILYAAGNNGVFKSTDSGGTWAGPNIGLTGQYVHILVIDPSSPDTLYAGTYGGGVFKSINGGGTWTAINTGLTGTNVSALAIDPANPVTLYAGTPGAGVFKSNNGGESWAATGLNSMDVRALAIDPETPTTLYANTVNGGYSGSDGLYKSTNGGESWAAISRDLTATYVYDLAIDPSSPATLYAWTSAAGVFKSTNGGERWSPINTGLSDTGVQALAIDPSAGATLYAGTLLGVFKSNNGGGNWTTANTGLKSIVSALAIDPSAPATLYGGTAPYGSVFKSTNGGGSWTAIHALYTKLQALAVDPSAPDTLYAGTSSDFFYDYPGVFTSTDGGANWTQSLYADVYALAMDPFAPATIYAGTNGGVFKSTNFGGTWAAANTGLTNQGVLALVISPTNRATLFAGTYGGVFQSTDSGGTWAAAGLASQVVQAVAINPATPATLYAGTFRGGVFRSTDAGATWAAANTGLTNLSVHALAINPTAPATLYAGTNGGVFRSTNSGGTWAAFNTGLPNLPVNALAFDPTGATTLYAGLGGGGVWQLTAPTTGSITALLPASAHSSGVNGAFYTTNVAVANTGALAASFTMKFLGNNQDGSNGTERGFNLDPGKSTTFVDVLGSVFNQTSSFGAIRITSNSSTLDIVSVTSTPGFGGSFGQTIPAISFADLVPAGSLRSILYIREGNGFRSNLILASGSFVSTDIDVALVSPAGETLATKTYSIPPNGMTQINRVVRDMGVSGPITGARLVLSSSTAGAAFTGVASVIDETTNDPTAVLVQAPSVSGSAPYIWLLPTSAHSSGANGAFYTTNVALANVGAAPASFAMKFLGNSQDGSGGPEQNFNLEGGKSVTYFDVLNSVFHQTSAFGAVRITSNSSSLNIVSVTSTPGFGGTLSQTIAAVFSSDLIPAGSSRSILYIREGDGFRSNLILASNANVSTTVDAVLVSPAGATLATKTYSVPPNGMTQINRVVRDMGVSGPITGARLVLSSSTPNAAFTAFASVIDETTNDPIEVEAR
jgi:photosystem II stability/assembly factor-like uncharacterized protein